MIAMKTWIVEISLAERDGRTHADAVLHSGAAEELRGVGQARLHPGEPDVPEIGDEIAASRALSELAHRLLDAAAGDIDALTHRPGPAVR